jgi:hypothetical protein
MRVVCVVKRVCNYMMVVTRTIFAVKLVYVSFGFDIRLCTCACQWATEVLVKVGVFFWFECLVAAIA